MGIKFDRSAETGILITCTSCEYWFSYRFDQGEAYDSGAAHALRAHDDSVEAKRVQTLLTKWRVSRKGRPVPQGSRHGTSRPAAHLAHERAHPDSVA